VATPKQISYAEVLLNEAGIDSHSKVKDFLQLRFKKSFVTDLTSSECSQLIRELLGEDD